jgi:dihydroflavonol-4-reductase
VEGQLLAWQRGEHGQRYVLGSGTGTFREVFGWVGEVLGKPASTRVLPRRLMALVAAGHELMGALRGVEPKITRQLVAIAARNRRYRSAKASAALGYAPADPRRGIEDCWRWMRDSGRS